MHAVTFEFKRAHLRSVAFGQKVVAKVPDMTPARFDLMYLIRHTWHEPWTNKRAGRRLSQKDIRHALGVHPSTVSKMIARLVRLKWVTNDDVDLSDERTKIIELTDLGVRRIEKAMRLVFKVRSHLKFFEDHFKGRYCKSGWKVIEAIDLLKWSVHWVARALGDTSHVWYWFGEED